MSFENKVAIITGSSRGIGKAIAIKLASYKCNVIINYNKSEEEAKNLKEYIEKNYKVKAITIKCDLNNENEIIEMIKKSLSEFEKIDILINNAGIEKDSLFMDKTKEDFNEILNVNLVAPFLLAKYISAEMKKNKYGKIINITSTNGIDTYYPESMDYDASKAALISLTHNLAHELAPYINVNAVAPGWTNTDMNKELDESQIEEENKKILLNRFATPEEIASVVVFLASDEASYINNEIIRVDGGTNNGCK